jgi:hypothetical protein
VKVTSPIGFAPPPTSTVAENATQDPKRPEGADDTTVVIVEGCVEGVIFADLPEGPLPTALVAETVNATGVPLTRPPTTTWSVAPGVGSVADPGWPAGAVMAEPDTFPYLGVTVNPVIADPPSFGTVKTTVADELPARGRLTVGTPGTEAAPAAAAAGRESMGDATKQTAVRDVRAATANLDQRLPCAR